MSRGVATRAEAVASAALPQLFTAGLFKDLARGRSSKFARLAVESGLLSLLPSNADVRDLFEQGFRTLAEVGNRSEYVYRSALVHKILLGTHSLRTACMLTEMRAGSARADVVVLNGTSSVYEIKSERDSLVRLQDQIASYRRVFAKVHVIAAEEHIAEIASVVPPSVGLMSLSRRFRIQTAREALEDFSGLCPHTLCDSLRTAEVAAVAQACGEELPRVPNTRLRAALEEVFTTHPVRVLHQETVRVLRRTRSQHHLSEFLGALPQSLHGLALATPIPKQHRQSLLFALGTPIGRAVSEWQ